ncbi:DUF1322 family protein [Borrelia crocidurae]|uniref:Uncharacterized protein n=1 Tax=Borrelia crocidurae (strain Achema) TaxID=1155096 RepID=I0FEF8_BORCA|nr:DUF1322 family protein [Borrelia crocidurae]AFI31864.1 Protein of unknown function (DUF1322)-containing protein [Borrelia crocidurae str. Achema]
MKIFTNYIRYRKERQKLLNSYFTFLDSLSDDKKIFYFPVIMNVCTFEEIKKMSYSELIEINRIAHLKLSKEKYEMLLLFKS